MKAVGRNVIVRREPIDGNRYPFKGTVVSVGSDVDSQDVTEGSIVMFKGDLGIHTIPEYPSCAVMDIDYILAVI